MSSGLYCTNCGGPASAIDMLCDRCRRNSGILPDPALGEGEAQTPSAGESAPAARQVAGSIIDALQRDNRRWKADNADLRRACGIALTELVWLAEQAKAREGGSVMRAIGALRDALACPQCGGKGTVTKSYGQGEFGDQYQESCDGCGGKGVVLNV